MNPKDVWSYRASNSFVPDCVMIVAHPDDEIVFAGSFLLDNADKKWLLISVTSPRQSFVGNRRKKTFLEKLPLVLGCDSLMLNFEDSGQNQKIQGDFHLDISSILSAQCWEKIVTHGPDGEYGHTHHKQVHSIVRDVCESMSLLERLFVFSPQKKDRAEISDRKKRLFTLTYDDNFDLRRDHDLVRFPFYLYNVYRDDGNGGWVESVVPFLEREGNKK
jgi:LmbE family N-acetylglucosaminyl deacetylase